MQVKKLYSRMVKGGGELNQSGIVLEYYIVQRQIGEQYCEIRSYGIQIKKLYVQGGGGINEESRMIGDIFFDEADAENFAEKLSRSLIEPSGLKAVIDEYVAETIAMRKNGRTA